jgi:hypothetical protein
MPHIRQTNPETWRTQNIINQITGKQTKGTTLIAKSHSQKKHIILIGTFTLDVSHFHLKPQSAKK